MLLTPAMVAVVLVVAPAATAASAPAGLDAQAWWRGLTEDAADGVSSLESVRAAVAVSGDVDVAAVKDLVWPGTAVVRLPDEARTTESRLVATLDAAAALGGALGAVVSGDAPDLPGLVVAKLFSALEDAPVSIAPARGGGLVGLGARLPVPDWLRTASVGLDTADAVERLHAAAPQRAVVVGPGWHRLRAANDVGHLDAGLAGWDATRALLHRR